MDGWTMRNNKEIWTQTLNSIMSTHAERHIWRWMDLESDHLISYLNSLVLITRFYNADVWCRFQCCNTTQLSGFYYIFDKKRKQRLETHTNAHVHTHTHYRSCLCDAFNGPDRSEDFAVGRQSNQICVLILKTNKTTPVMNHITMFNFHICFLLIHTMILS